MVVYPELPLISAGGVYAGRYLYSNNVPGTQMGIWTPPFSSFQIRSSLQVNLAGEHTNMTALVQVRGLSGVIIISKD